MNYSFFDDINTEHKAYWLGFFLADGCIPSDKRSIRIDLKREDKEHLEKFLSSLGSNHKVYDYRTSSLVAIKSRKLASALVKNFEDIPVLTDTLYRHFWRGVFDGDGHIAYHNNPQRKNYSTFHCELVGTKEICAGFKEFLLDNDIKTKASVLKIKNANCWKFATSGNQLVVSIHSLLYDNSSVSLDRKQGVVSRGF
jgi:DNA-binding transcriptional regulator WhiA